MFAFPNVHMERKGAITNSLVVRIERNAPWGFNSPHFRTAFDELQESFKRGSALIDQKVHKSRSVTMPEPRLNVLSIYTQYIRMMTDLCIMQLST